MTNCEKFKKELQAIADFKFAVSKMDNSLRGCEYIACDYCLFSGHGACKQQRIKWLCAEYAPKILDTVEKNYLSSMIRPFKNRVTAISKIETISNKHYIVIEYDSPSDYIILPDLKDKSMYNGMELGKRYTVKELEL